MPSDARAAALEMKDRNLTLGSVMRAPDRDPLADFGMNAARMRILRIVLGHTEVSTARLIAESEMSINGARAHILALEKVGILNSRHDTHPRGAGHITYWSADVDTIEEILDDLRSFLLA